MGSSEHTQLKAVAAPPLESSVANNSSAGTHDCLYTGPALFRPCVASRSHYEIMIILSVSHLEDSISQIFSLSFFVHAFQLFGSVPWVQSWWYKWPVQGWALKIPVFSVPCTATLLASTAIHHKEKLLWLRLRVAFLYEYKHEEKAAWPCQYSQATVLSTPISISTSWYILFAKRKHSHAQCEPKIYNYINMQEKAAFICGTKSN